MALQRAALMEERSTKATQPSLRPYPSALASNVFDLPCMIGTHSAVVTKGPAGSVLARR